MILTCPNCATRYLVNPAKLRPGGRRVRCARCGETWFEEAPPQSEPDAPDQVLPPEANPQVAPTPDPAADAETRASRRAHRTPPRRFGDTPNLPAIPGVRNRWMEVAGWVGLVVFVVAVTGGAWFFRSEITTAWPAATRLYDTLGIETAAHADAAKLPPLEDRLRFRDLRPTQQFVDGVLTLIISGRIENVGPVAETVPPVEVVLLDDRQLDLATWLFEVEKATLQPGETVTFETRLENPPAAAQDIRVSLASGTAGGNRRR